MKPDAHRSRPSVADALVVVLEDRGIELATARRVVEANLDDSLWTQFVGPLVDRLEDTAVSLEEREGASDKAPPLRLAAWGTSRRTRAIGTSLPVPYEELPPLPVGDLTDRLRLGADPNNECDCASSVPGTLVPFGNDEDHLFVQACDECSADDDYVAARRVARAVGWHVRIRFDAETRRTWRPFVARPGEWDDRDFVAVDADEYGWAPEAEIALSRLIPTRLRIAVAALRARRPGRWHARG